MRKLILCFALTCLLAGGGRLYAQWSITAPSTNFTQNFDGMGSGTTLPAGFQIISPRSAAIGFVDGAMSAGSISGTATGAAYNFGYNADRAIGVINSGTYTSGKYVILQITNNTGGVINNITLSWNYEKYRTGSRAWTWNFYHGATTGANINVAAGDQTYAGDGDNNGNPNPPTSTAKSVTITGLNIPAGNSYYFRWVLTGSGGSTNGQGLAIDDVVINASPSCTPGLPAVALGADVAYCQDSTLALVLNAGNAGSTYNWNNGAATTQTYTVTGPGTYTVKVTDANGCIGRDTITVTQKPNPTVNLGNDTAYCAGTPFSLTLNAQNPGATYNWNNGAAATQTFAVTGDGTYVVTVTAPNGCRATDSLTVTENALPAVNLGNDTSFCAGTAFTLILDAGNPGATYDWNGGEATTQTYQAETAGIYGVSVTDGNGCVNSDIIVLSYNSPSIVALGNDTAYCAGTAFTLTLDAQNPGATYDWNNGATNTQTLTVDTAGTYTVTITDVHGCQDTDEITVTENALPIVALGNDTSYCVGSAFALLLDAGNIGSTYSWNGSSVLTSQVFSVTQAGTYSVQVTNGNGCSATDAVTVTENALPTVDLEDNTLYCTGATFSMLLDAGNPGATYSWNGGIATTQTYTANGAGTYTVTVTDANGCVNSDSTVITEVPLPIVDLGNDTAFCAGSAFSLVLNAQNPGASYSWNGGVATTQTFLATQPGTYTVNVTDVYGCSQTHSIEIGSMAVPTVNLGNDINTTNATQVLNAGPGFTQYQWTPGGQNTAQVTVSQTGNYTVTVTGGNGCTASDTVHVTFINTSSINEAGEVLGLNIFPNPGTGVFNISTQETGTYSVHIFNLGGQTVFNHNSTEPLTQVDISQLPAGVYLLQVRGSHTYKTERIIVARQ